jgi:hypothetical protein
MRGGACLGCGRPVANTAANAIGIGCGGGRVRWAHVDCFEVARAKAEAENPPKPWRPPGDVVYTKRCPRCGRKVKRGTVKASQGYVWHAVPGREPHLLWMPVNLSAQGSA